MNKPLIVSEDKHTGIEVYIQEGRLEATGWYDSIVGIQPEDIKIYYCPMCGRELK
jgi:hypothetical protein